MSFSQIHSDKCQTFVRLGFLAPETYEELVTILAEHSEEDQLTIVERLRKCHHPSLAEGNKEKLQVGFCGAECSK